MLHTSDFSEIDIADKTGKGHAIKLRRLGVHSRGKRVEKKRT
jgi:hypothetical protein